MGFHGRMAGCVAHPKRQFVPLSGPRNLERREVKQRFLRAKRETGQGRAFQSVAELDQQRRLQWAMHNEAGIAFYISDITAIIVNPMAVKR